MTTINTIEDLVRLLDEKPEWAEALRSRLQTRELTELPGKFESFRAEMHQAFAHLAQTVGDLAQTVKGLVDAQAETNRRLDKAEEERRDLRQTVGDLAQTVGGLVQTVKGLVDALTETNRRLDRVDGNVQELRSEFNRLRDDFGPVKAAHVRNAALREVADIARSIGCTLVKLLGPEEVYDLHRGKDTSGISSDQLKSFRYGDLIIEATDINGSTCYLAVEVSYTVDKRDTSRSVRNAQFLTLFTSRPAFAGVAGVRFDDEIASGSDGVFLYQVYARNLEVD